MTINNDKHYESNIATASDAPGNLTCSPETVTRTSSGVNQVLTLAMEVLNKKKSYRTIAILPIAMNLGIDQGIALNILKPQTILTTSRKGVITDVALDGASINRNLQQVSRTGVNRSTPGVIYDYFRVVGPSSPVLVGIVGTSPPCGLNVIQEVGNKRQSTSPGLVGK